MRSTFFFSLICLLGACHMGDVNSFDNESITKSIQQSMDEQEQAWNRGDIPGFMKWYWKSDSLTFIGSRGLTHGWNQTLANYQKSYPTTEAMGKLRFTNLDVQVLDQENAFVIGKWELLRISDTLSGHYSLLWKKKGQFWFIVADHSS